MRRANTTFVNLRATLDDAAPLVEESKPVARKLRPFFAQLRPLARDARPTLRDLSRTIRAPGADNDLIELTQAAEPLRDIAVSPAPRDGRSATARCRRRRRRSSVGDARARDRPPVRARPHGLVRRLQPLRASTTRSAARAGRACT